jgi:hypothetical protein
MPAIEASRFPRRLRDVMAGKGLRVSECRESIILPDKFKARRLVNIERQSGIELKRLLDRSSDVSEPESGTNAAVVME